MATLKVPVTSEDHIQGNMNAPITIVEYGDYECPYCGQAYPIIKALQQRLGQQLRFVFRNFPLREAHPHAEPAAETAEFAADYDRFWEMHDLLFENQKEIGLPLFLELGQQLELPVNDLQLAIDNRTYSQKIRNDFLGGVKSGVNGTPTLYINEQRYNGVVRLDAIVSAIEQLSIK